MAHLVNTPQFRVPFTVEDGECAVVEQDSVEDKTQNAITCLRCRPGDRVQIPTYGVPDLALRQYGKDDAIKIAAIIEEWEPDVNAEIMTEAIKSATGEFTVNIDLTAQGSFEKESH